MNLRFSEIPQHIVAPGELWRGGRTHEKVRRLRQIVAPKATRNFECNRRA